MPVDIFFKIYKKIVPCVTADQRFKM